MLLLRLRAASCAVSQELPASQIRLAGNQQLQALATVAAEQALYRADLPVVLRIKPRTCGPAICRRQSTPLRLSEMQQD